MPTMPAVGATAGPPTGGIPYDSTAARVLVGRRKVRLFDFWHWASFCLLANLVFARCMRCHWSLQVPSGDEPGRTQRVPTGKKGFSRARRGPKTGRRARAAAVPPANGFHRLVTIYILCCRIGHPAIYGILYSAGRLHTLLGSWILKIIDKEEAECYSFHLGLFINI